MTITKEDINKKYIIGKLFHWLYKQKINVLVAVLDWMDMAMAMVNKKKNLSDPPPQYKKMNGPSYMLIINGGPHPLDR